MSILNKPFNEPRGALARPMKISDSALAVMRGSDGNLVEAFGVYEPPPGVLPQGVKGSDIAMAADYSPSDLYGYAGRGYLHEGLAFPGFAYLAELAQRPEYRKISAVIAKEMTRKWIKLQSAGDDDKSEKIAELNQALDDFKIQDVFRHLAEHDGFFGRAHLYIDTGATENPDELKTPLVVDSRKIAKGSVKGFRAVEPLWCYPAAYNAAKPLRADFYEPPSWYVQGQTVHRTRLLTFVSREVPDILKPAYAFAGLSMSQMAKPYVDNWIRTRQSVSDMLHSFSVMVLKTNLGDILNGGAATQLMKRLAMFTMGRDNKGVYAINQENEELLNVSAPLSGLDSLQAQAQEQMASVASIPLVKLLGVTPSGLNASSDGEIRVFYDDIGALQEHLFSRHLRTVIDIVQLNLWGKIDSDITFSFEPLWQLDDTAKAANRKTDADTDVELIDAGVLSPVEVRTRLANDENSPYAGLDIDDVPEPPEEERDPSILSDPSKGAEGKTEERDGA